MNQKYVGECRDRRERTAQPVTQKQKRRPHLENAKEISLTEVQERRKREEDRPDKPSRDLYLSRAREATGRL